MRALAIRCVAVLLGFILLVPGAECWSPCQEKPLPSLAQSMVSHRRRESCHRRSAGCPHQDVPCHHTTGAKETCPFVRNAVHPSLPAVVPKGNVAVQLPILISSSFKLPTFLKMSSIENSTEFPCRSTSCASSAVLRI